MNNFAAGLVRFVLRLLLVGVALVFAASLLVVVMLLASAWGVRAMWARLTGRPVTPWVMRVDPGAGWQSVFRAGERWQPRGRAAAPGGPTVNGQGRGRPDLLDVADVTDVQVKEVKAH
ncbi:MAG: hypothetical protein JWQ88_803 [Rhodoferax sp.]|nr:hypothetical protein [Rhodoferax sp.]